MMNGEGAPAVEEVAGGTRIRKAPTAQLGNVPNFWRLCRIFSWTKHMFNIRIIGTHRPLHIPSIRAHIWVVRILGGPSDKWELTPIKDISDSHLV